MIKQSFLFKETSYQLNNLLRSDPLTEHIKEMC